MKQSHAFAAFRASLITDKQHAVINELVPIFNAECEKIKKQAEDDFQKYHNQAKSDNLKRTLMYDLIMARDETVQQVQVSMKRIIDERLARDGAGLQEVDLGNGKTKLIAEFPDGSTASIPKQLYINYSLFNWI